LEASIEAVPSPFTLSGGDWSPEGLLAAINGARQRSLPETDPVDLIHAYQPLALLEQSSPTESLQAQASASVYDRAVDIQAAPFHPQRVSCAGLWSGAVVRPRRHASGSCPCVVLQTTSNSVT